MERAPVVMETRGGARSDAGASSERRRGGCRERASSRRTRKQRAEPGPSRRLGLGGQWLDPLSWSALGVRAAAAAAAGRGPLTRGGKRGRRGRVCVPTCVRAAEAEAGRRRGLRVLR